MSIAAKIPSPASRRPILGPGGNTFRAPEQPKLSTKKVVAEAKKPQVKKKHSQSDVADQPTAKLNNEIVDKVADISGRGSVKDDASVESLCSSDSSSVSGSSAKKLGSCRTRVNRSGVRLENNKKVSSDDPAVVKRCHWITTNSDQLYVKFHDEEWGVPVHDDKKLFELLVFSQALAELSWPVILHKRDSFRKHFEDFDAASVAQFSDAKMISLEAFISKPKVEAVVENAKQIVKVQREFGSFDKYCWNFVNHKQVKNSIRYANQVPAKSPKAQLISKDMMQRGFRCVGPTVIYSFMEEAGIVNDHLLSCFRYHECTGNNIVKSSTS